MEPGAIRSMHGRLRDKLCPRKATRPLAQSFRNRGLILFTSNLEFQIQNGGVNALPGKPCQSQSECSSGHEPRQASTV